jgi:hypothetical protein
MIRFSYRLYFILFLLAGFSVNAQTLTAIGEGLNTVEAAKATFRQNIKELEDGLVEYSTVEVDTKGKEIETFYRFSFSDIDDNTVRSITKKDVIVIQLLVEGKQKLIQKISDGGDKIAYLSEIQMFASNAENGTDLEKAIKEHIPNASSYEANRLSLNTYKEHLDWLLKNLADVDLPKKQIIQKVSSNDVAGKLFLDQTFNSKSKTKNELRELNLATLNPNSIGYKISGDEFIISADSRRNIKGIKYTEDGEQKNYSSDLKLYATSVTNGKDIYKVLKGIIPLAEEQFENTRTNVESEANALSFLNKVIADVSANEETISQNLSIQNNIAQLKQTETQPDESTEYVYNFNFGDINANNIDFDGQKDKLFAILPIKKSVNFIQKIENGDLQNYTDEVKIFFNTIEDAIVGVAALKHLATTYGTKIDNREYATGSLSAAVEQLKKIMTKVTIEDDSYDLFIEVIDEKTSTIKITTVFSNLKKSVETINEVSLININPENCSIQVRGKHVVAELNTKHLEKIVKTYVDGEIKPYQYKIGIEAKGIEEARQIVAVMENLAKKLN